MVVRAPLADEAAVDVDGSLVAPVALDLAVAVHGLVPYVAFGNVGAFDIVLAGGGHFLGVGGAVKSWRGR